MKEWSSLVGETYCLEGDVRGGSLSPGVGVGEKPRLITLLVRNRALQSWQGGQILDTPSCSVAILS